MSSDEERWSEAQSLLDREPTAPAERRLRRWRRQRVALVLGVSLLVGVPVGIAAVRFSDGSSADSPADVPTWQVVVGVVLAVAGLVGALVATVAQFRANRRMSAWRSPLSVLTNEQRKKLLAAVRGRATVSADRLSLARHMASNTLQQRWVLGVHLGLAVLWIGQAIAFPSWWRAALAGAFVVLEGVSVPLVLRQERQARRFLEEHPAPDGSVA